MIMQHITSFVNKQNEFGVWEIFLPNNVDGSPPIPHGSRVKVIHYNKFNYDFRKKC